MFCLQEGLTLIMGNPPLGVKKLRFFFIWPHNWKKNLGVKGLALYCVLKKQTHGQNESDDTTVIQYHIVSITQLPTSNHQSHEKQNGFTSQIKLNLKTSILGMKDLNQLTIRSFDCNWSKIDKKR